ncbi:MAG: hypothetical protein U0990_09765 [Candidatus Nanopelagicales bacterium]|nr:hypothetical protein [Candidatus Nanopelagicales bacterium]
MKELPISRERAANPDNRGIYHPPHEADDYRETVITLYDECDAITAKVAELEAGRKAAAAELRGIAKLYGVHKATEVHLIRLADTLDPPPPPPPKPERPYRIEVNRREGDWWDWRLWSISDVEEHGRAHTESDARATAQSAADRHWPPSEWAGEAGTDLSACLAQAGRNEPRNG